MDIALITGIVSGLKTAGDIAKSILELKSITDVRFKVIELQGVILSAQSSALDANAKQSLLIDTIRNLKEEIADIEAWEKEKQRYILVSPWDGFLVYAVKKDGAGTEPPHWICTKCYQARKKSIINQKRRNALGYWFCVCPICNSQIDSPHNNTHSPKYAEETVIK